MPQELTVPSIRTLPLWLTPQSRLTLHYQYLYHVGQLDGSPHLNGDLEGPLLSASLHPEQWRKFADLGDCPRWKISKARDLRLLDMTSWRWQKHKPHLEWGIREGLIVQERPSKFSMTSPLLDFWHQRQNNQWTMGGPEQMETALVGVALCLLHKFGKPCYDGLWWKKLVSPSGNILPPRAGLVPSEKLVCRIC